MMYSPLLISDFTFWWIWQKNCRMNSIMVTKSFHHPSSITLSNSLKMQHNQLTRESLYLQMHLVLLQLLDKDCVLTTQTKQKTQSSPMPFLAPFEQVSKTITYHREEVRLVNTQIAPWGATRTKPETLTPQVLTTLQWICMLIARAMTLLTELWLHFSAEQDRQKTIYKL